MTRQFHWYDKAKWPFSRTQKSPFTYNTLQINRLRKYAEIRWFQRKEDSGTKKRRHKTGKMSVFLTKGHSSHKVRTVRHTQIHQAANPCQPSNKHSESRQLYPIPPSSDTETTGEAQCLLSGRERTMGVDNVKRYRLYRMLIGKIKKRQSTTIRMTHRYGYGDSPVIIVTYTILYI